MKLRVGSGILMLLLSMGLFAQVPQGFNYQAVARDASGNEITNTALQVQVAILSAVDPDIIVWEEEHAVLTNDYGIMNIVVGDPGATPVPGGIVPNFESIDWQVDPLFLRTEIYYLSTWHDLGNSRLVSVPYAMIADQATALTSNTFSLGGATLSIVGGDTSLEDALFEVRRSDGEVLFSVSNQGVYINVPYNLPPKGVKGGFAIGGFDATKKGATEEYLVVTRDSTRVYVKQPAKGAKGGFAIGGFDETKAGTGSYLNLTHQNYLIGQDAGDSITDGVFNAFFGYEAGASMKTGDNNVFLGHQTGYSTTTGHENVFIGNRSGYAASGYDNIFIGNQAGEQSSGTTHSTFIGNEAGWNVSGDDNILIGDRAGYNLYVSSHEVMNTVVLGIDASRNFGGTSNTILGYGAGSHGGSSGSGDYNTFVGASAGYGSSGAKLGNGNVCLGYDAGSGKAGDNKLYIANNSTTALIYGEFDNEYLLVTGDMNVTGTLTSAKSSAKSDKRYKSNIESIGVTLNAISNIPAVYYDWKTDEFPDERFSTDRQIGFIAQDVEKYFPELVSTNRDGYKSLDYGKMTVVLLQAVKEQQAIINAQDEEAGDLRMEVQSLEDRLSQLESVISTMVQNQE